MKVPLPGEDSARPGPRHLGELFADRLSEAGAFKASLRAFRRRLESSGDDGSARYNVLTFHGLGGIGKSALSERLEAWTRGRLPLVNDWGPPPEVKVAATARIDLHGSVGQIDLLATLLALRSGVGSLRSRWPMFDLAFAAYWSAVRPGEALPRHRGSDELANSVASLAEGALNDIGAALDLAGTGIGGGLAVSGVRKLIGTIRRRQDVRLAIDAFPGFEEFLLSCADDPSPLDPRPLLACQIAGLLALELQYTEPCPLVTVFVDTTERLHLDPRRVSEAYLNELIFRMPNVLFILTGRDMLNWWDGNEAVLPYVGSWIWPGLAPGASEDPRQHLIGNLSPKDTRALIDRGRRVLNLPISDEVIEELVVASAGLPQYLELARQVALSIKASGPGRQVRREDVTGSLKSLVLRVLDDVPPDEQRAIRAACLFQAFDTELIAAAANVDHGCAERAVQRPMIDRYEGERFPYRMHDAVREAIRRTDHNVHGGWAERDWELAATRAAAALHRLHDRAKEAENNREILDALGLTIRLACDQRTVLEHSESPAYEDWLAQAIVYGPSFNGLRSRVPPTSRTEYGRMVLDFLAGKTRDSPLPDRLALLRKVFDSDHPLSAPAGRHLGYTYRNQRRWDEALAIFEELIARNPSVVNRSERINTLSLARRFVDASMMAKQDGAGTNIGRIGEYNHGLPDRYFSGIDAKIDRLRRAGRQREVLEAQGDLIERRVFFGRDVSPDEITALLEVAEQAGHSVATRSALVALVLNRVAGREAIRFALERLRGLDLGIHSNDAIGLRFTRAELCDALLNNDEDRIEQLHRAASRVAVRSSRWIPVECFFDHVGLPLPEVETQWVEPYPVVRSRWAGHLESYLRRH